MSKYICLLGRTFVTCVQKGSIVKVNVSKWRWQQLEVLKTKYISDKVYFLRLKRTRDEAELCMVDVVTGEVKTIINEISKPYLNKDFVTLDFVKGISQNGDTVRLELGISDVDGNDALTEQIKNEIIKDIYSSLI